LLPVDGGQYGQPLQEYIEEFDGWDEGPSAE
jgi:hypothetical protein